MKELYKKFHNNLRSKTSIDEFLQLKSIKPEVPESHNLSFLQIKNKNSNKLKTNNKISLNNSITSQTNEGLKNNKYIIEDTTIQKEKDSSEETDYKVISKYLNSELKDIDIQKLPRNWDWTNVGGVNYTPKVKNQGDCGSCYIMASVSGLETRLRVKTNNQDKTKLSENYFINKSFYTEGCEGGYPILLGKFGSEFGVATEECTSSYEGRQDPNMSVCDSSSEKRKYFVGKYGYLGGYYGNTNEVEMIKELRARGPIMGNIKVPSALMYYQSGIFNDNYHGGPNSGKWSLETMNDRGDLVEVVEHSTLIVGYGEENGYKYWKIMNSWGSDWGEKGFFKVLRGENLIAVETMGDYLDITFKDTN